jgi:hypothetical protein
VFGQRSRQATPQPELPPGPQLVGPPGPGRPPVADGGTRGPRRPLLGDLAPIGARSRPSPLDLRPRGADTPHQMTRPPDSRFTLLKAPKRRPVCRPNSNTCVTRDDAAVGRGEGPKGPFVGLTRLLEGMPAAILTPAT